MKQKLKAALLVGAVLGLCVQTPVLAAQAKKAEQTTSKKSIKKAPVAAKSSLPAAKSAGKSGVKFLTAAFMAPTTGCTITVPMS